MENRKLVSMVDYVLKKSKSTDLWDIIRYANFLRQPLELWMFVPVGQNGEVLEEPKEYKGDYDLELLQWEHSWDRVLFEDCDVVEEYPDELLINHNGHPIMSYQIDKKKFVDFDGEYHYDTIEKLIWTGLTLTENAL